jgi:hypothetical protein
MPAGGGMTKMRILECVVLCAALGGCAGQQTTADASWPTDYREIILRNKATLFKDPESVRDVAISGPSKSIFGWRFCLKANAKNGFGGYTGQTMYTVLLYSNGNPPILQPVTIYDGCGSEYFEAFHELEGNYVPPAPAPPQAAAPPLKRGKPKAPMALNSGST